MSNLSRGQVAIVGAAESDLGRVAPGVSVVDLMAQALHRALDESGLTLADVDGVFSTTNEYKMATVALCEYMGIRPKVTDSSYIGGASFMSHIAHAASAIATGSCEVAVIAYGSTARSVMGKVGPGEVFPYETPYQPMRPIGPYALAASRHMYEFGTTREQLAEVAVAARKWAQMNPKAWAKDDLSVADVVNARMVASPLGKHDCCLLTDGGGVVIVTSAERARSLRKPPVFVLGMGEAVSHLTISEMPDLTQTAAVQSGQRAYEMAGLGPQDIDVIGVYDAFTISTLLFLEDLGFCPKGEGGRFVEGGSIAPGGSHAVNTNGGGLSYCHPGMYGLLLLIENIRQLRGECGERQIASAEVAIAHGNGGVLSAQSTVILGNQATI